MRFRLFPQETNFFDLFEEQVGRAVDAASFFKQVVSNGIVDDAVLEKIQDIEHQADKATHTIIAQLDQTFITPFDREDIHTLAKEMDDVVDMINTIISRLKIYNLSGVNEHLVAFAGLIEESVGALSCAIKGLRNTKNCPSVSKACIEINRLENMGDSLRDAVLTDLFETEKDPIAIIKWKEIYQDAETVLDICEDVANVVESIIVKQA